MYYFVYENINKIVHKFNWFNSYWNFFEVSKPAKISYTYFFHKFFEYFSQLFDLSNNLKENW